MVRPADGNACCVQSGCLVASKYAISALSDGTLVLADGTKNEGGSTTAVTHDLSGVSVAPLSRSRSPESGLTALGSSPDNDILVGGAISGRIYVWMYSTGWLLEKFAAHNGVVEHLEFTSDGNVLLSGGKDGRVHAWNMHQIMDTTRQHSQIPHPATTIQAHSVPISTLSVCDGLPAGTLIITTSADRSARFFHLESGRQTGHVQLPAVAVATVLSVSETAAYIAVANGDILIVDLSMLPAGDTRVSYKSFLKLRTPLSQAPVIPTTLALSPSPHEIIACYNDGIVRIFEAATGTVVRVYRRHSMVHPVTALLEFAFDMCVFPEEVAVYLVEVVDYLLPKIDLNNWKVTLPIGNAASVKPPEILDYAKNDVLKDFMYNDSNDGSLVFYTYPCCSTANSCYSRTELREQMVAGSNSTNWTFQQGGRMKGTLKLDAISNDADGKPHRAIVMQIHGRLTNAQRDVIGKCDNNAPPMLKIYWHKGLVRVKTKVLKDLNATDTEILHTDAWRDDAGFNFSKVVGNDRFTLEIIASEGRMEVTLNENERVVYDGIHVEKWGIFENYFKAGNYLISTNVNAFSRVKFYSLEVTH